MNVHINSLIKLIIKKLHRYWLWNILIQILDYVSHRIKIKIEEEYKVLSLRGVIYHSNNHFCSRIVSVDGTIWYNDSITTGNNSIEDGHLSTTSYEELKNCNGKILVLAIYA